jgi:BolA family transcriptional regulator, general stress-responsive regulator
MTRDERIHTILKEHLSPSNLQVINDSHQHAGHSASPGTGDSHYQIIIVSNVFQDKSRLEIHRIVNSLLKDEFEHGLHALSIDASS